jgi:hypothetical protein
LRSNRSYIFFHSKCFYFTFCQKTSSQSQTTTIKKMKMQHYKQELILQRNESRITTSLMCIIWSYRQWNTNIHLQEIKIQLLAHSQDFSTPSSLSLSLSFAPQRNRGRERGITWVCVEPTICHAKCEISASATHPTKIEP